MNTPMFSGKADAGAASVTSLPKRVILASASPRRRELLLQIGIDPVIRPPEIDESSIRHHDPLRLPVELAQAKGRAVAANLGPDEARLPILAADTVVAVADEILEKPSDRDDAARMLRALSGRTHRVVTGIAVIRRRDGADGLTTRYAESRVTFAELSASEIEACLETDEWVGVAGAYRIQGVAARYITDLSGSYSNVVGLPLHLVYSMFVA